MHSVTLKEVDVIKRTVSVLLVTAALAGPMVASASARGGERRANVTVRSRLYDPYRRDYHVWDQREERAYRSYLAERHRRYLSYQRQRLADRRAYWRWRHERDERIEHARRR